LSFCPTLLTAEPTTDFFTSDLNKRRSYETDKQHHAHANSPGQLNRTCLSNQRDVLGRFSAAFSSLLPLRILLTGDSDFLLLYGDDTTSSDMLLEVVRSVAGSTRVEDREVVRGCGSFGSLLTAAAAESRAERLVNNASLHRRYKRCS
jgi:uncharacterized protein CbrC (UPF0167 family)